ncbi:MAG: hypothetical protein JSS49_29505 [Planctomycetes bacterium]|nr:hypothetical protein [Planctomycetota bacterium]
MFVSPLTTMNRSYSVLGFQFSRRQAIRAAMALAIGCAAAGAVLCAWYFPPRAISRQVRRNGGRVNYKPDINPRMPLDRFAVSQRKLLGLTPTDEYIHQVDLDQAHVGDQWLRNLKPLSGLQRLCIHERQLGPGLADLSQLQGLSTVRIWQCCTGDLGHLQHLPKLEHVILFQTDCSDLNVGPLASIPTLTKLEFSTSTVTSQQLEQISKIRTLNMLGLAASNLNSDSMRGLAHLAQLPNLDNLYISDVTTEGAKSISKIQSLSYLFIRNGHLTDESIAVLAELPHLRHLNLENNSHPINEATLRQKMPRCKFINYQVRQ